MPWTRRRGYGDRASRIDEVRLDGRKLVLGAEPAAGGQLLLYYKPVGEVTGSRVAREPENAPAVRLPALLGTLSIALAGKPNAAAAAHVETLSVEDKLKFAIINGEKSVGEGEHKRTLEEIL